MSTVMNPFHQASVISGTPTSLTGAQISGLSSSVIPALSTTNLTTISLGHPGSGGTGGTWAAASAHTPTNLSVESSGTVKLSGKNPDILIGDISLKETLAGIQQQLGILQSNKGLEARWEKLRKIKEEYDACVADLVEKETMWNELKR